MSEKISTTIEDYLSFLYIFERDGVPMNGSRLAELMGVSAPTVTNTLKRMVRDELITMDVNHSPHLTERGSELAKTVMRRHMLAEWMLVKMLSWSKVHQEAHDFEHSISEEVENALLRELKQPETCPHGNPLPGYEKAVENWVPLTTLKKGDQITIRRVHELAEEIPGLLSFLEEKQIGPGVKAEIEEILPFNQTVTIKVNQQPVTLGFSTARQIFVEI